MKAIALLPGTLRTLCTIQGHNRPLSKWAVLNSALLSRGKERSSILEYELCQAPNARRDDPPYGSPGESLASWDHRREWWAKGGVGNSTPSEWSPMRRACLQPSLIQVTGSPRKLVASVIAKRLSEQCLLGPGQQLCTVRFPVTIVTTAVQWLQHIGNPKHFLQGYLRLHFKILHIPRISS